MQNAWDYGGGLVEEGEVGFKQGEVRGWCGGGSPEKRVVVGEEGKENSEEEGRGCLGVGRVLVRGLRGEGVGKGGFITAEDHESRKRLGAVSYRHARGTRFCGPFEIKRGFAAGVYPQASKARYMCGGEKFNYVLVGLYLTWSTDGDSLNWRNDLGYVNRGLVVFFIIMARQLVFGDSGCCEGQLVCEVQPSAFLMGRLPRSPLPP